MPSYRLISESSHITEAKIDFKIPVILFLLFIFLVQLFSLPFASKWKHMQLGISCNSLSHASRYLHFHFIISLILLSHSFTCVIAWVLEVEKRRRKHTTSVYYKCKLISVYFPSTTFINSRPNISLILFCLSSYYHKPSLHEH